MERDRERDTEAEREREKTDRARDEDIVLEGIGNFVDICLQQFFETINL